MDSETVLEINKHRRYLFVELPEKHKQERQDISLMLLKLIDKCDHNENGVSKVSVGRCQICNKIIGAKIEEHRVPKSNLNLIVE